MVKRRVVVAVVLAWGAGTCDHGSRVGDGKGWGVTSVVYRHLTSGTRPDRSMLTDHAAAGRASARRPGNLSMRQMKGRGALRGLEV